MHTSYFTGSESTKRVNMLKILILHSFRIQTSLTVGRLYSDTSIHNKVSLSLITVQILFQTNPT